MDEPQRRVQHACVNPDEVVDPNRSTWLLGHTHPLKSHEVYWSSIAKKTSPSDMLRLMAGNFHMPSKEIVEDIATSVHHSKSASTPSSPHQHLWHCRVKVPALNEANEHEQDSNPCQSQQSRHAISLDNLWIAETWAHVVQMLRVQNEVSDAGLIESPLSFMPCPDWQCQCAGFECVVSATTAGEQEKEGTPLVGAEPTPETLTRIQGKAVFGGMFENGQGKRTAVVFITSARSSSTPIDAVRPLVEIVASMGASTVHFIMRSAMIAKSAKTIKSEFRDMRIVFWTEQMQSFDWFNNAMCSPLAVVSIDDHEKMDATLGYLKQSYEHLSPLGEGPISDRFGLTKGDVVHSQRTVPKLTRSLRRFDG
jgi:hypothetical protein